MDWGKLPPKADNGTAGWKEMATKNISKTTKIGTNQRPFLRIIQNSNPGWLIKSSEILSDWQCLEETQQVEHSDLVRPVWKMALVCKGTKGQDWFSMHAKSGRLHSRHFAGKLQVKIIQIRDQLNRLLVSFNPSTVARVSLQDNSCHAL